MTVDNDGKPPESPPHDDSDVVTGAVAMSPSKLVGRAQAARLLGVSKSTLRRMEGASLTPVVGPKNVRLFQEEQIESLIIRRRLHSGEPERTSGEVAAEVFGLFDEGVHPVVVVKQRQLDPEVVESLHQRWTKLRSRMVLSDGGLKELCSIINPLSLADHGHPGDEEDLLFRAREWAAERDWNLCQECFRKRATFCPECAKDWGLRAQKRLVQHRTRQR